MKEDVRSTLKSTQNARCYCLGFNNAPFDDWEPWQEKWYDNATVLTEEGFPFSFDVTIEGYYSIFGHTDRK